MTIYIPYSGILGNVQINIRFWAIFPFLWYGLFAFVLRVINNSQISKLLILSQVLWTMFLVYPNDYYGSKDAENIFAQTFIKSGQNEYSTFENYYKIDDFTKLSKNYPEIKESNIVCFGFASGVALFNGYKTYDAYLNIYPLENWKNWKKINNEEFILAGKTDFFTNKVFLFSNELENTNKITTAPKWNLIELRKAKVKYIISTLKHLPRFEKVAESGSLTVFRI
jgi:hypothetical protein